MPIGRTIGPAVALLSLLTACATAPAQTWQVPEEPAAPSIHAAPRRTAAAISYPAAGGGAFRTAGPGPSASGHGGELLRYRVAIERDIRGIGLDDFATFVTGTLDDPRGWTAGGRWRLQRVGAGTAADFTVYLVTPGTRDGLCGGTPDGYTSCRNGGKVVLNVARWVKGVPGYGAPLRAYRRYMVNHEVGHRLGHGHERCPGAGTPAPVMQQQTLGLHGCTANPWPYRDGERYAGAAGTYDDPVPDRDEGVKFDVG